MPTTFYGGVETKAGPFTLYSETGGPGPIRKLELHYRRVVVTPAQLLAASGTPVSLVPAPGAGKWLEFFSAHVALDYNSAAYAGIAAGEDLVVRYTNGSGAIVSTTLETTGFLDQTSDQLRTFKAIATDLVPVVNAPLVLQILAGEITTGDSPLYLDVFYAVHETGL